MVPTTGTIYSKPAPGWCSGSWLQCLLTLFPSSLRSNTSFFHASESNMERQPVGWQAVFELLLSSPGSSGPSGLFHHIPLSRIHITNKWRYCVTGALWAEWSVLRLITCTSHRPGAKNGASSLLCRQRNREVSELALNVQVQVLETF